MKKLFTLLLCAGMGLATQAQNNFTVSPTNYGADEIGFVAEGMSDDLKWVAGSDQLGNYPAVWNTETNTMSLLIEQDSVWIDPMVWGEVGEPYWDYKNYEGVFHAITANGVAVGSMTDANYISHPVCYDANNGTYFRLFETAQDAGSEAYGITADGSTIVGYHFDESWTTYACVWTNNGQTRTDLPWPTNMRFEIDYASARWISADGAMILGYVQDFNTGDWVAVAWRRNGNSYEPVPFGDNFYQTREFDDNGELIEVDCPNPYYKFEPCALSANGVWASVFLVESYDVNDWFNTPAATCARYNFTTQQLEVFANDSDEDGPELFGIANDGTAVGRRNQEDAVIWNVNSNEIVRVAEQYAGDAYVDAWMMSALCFVTGDGCYTLGYSMDEYGNESSFILRLRDHVGIENVEAEPVAPRVKGIYDMMGRKLDKVNGRGVYIIDGKKVLVF